MLRNNKILALITATAMTISTLSGCGFVNDESKMDETSKNVSEIGPNDDTEVVYMNDPQNDEYGKLYCASIDEAHIAQDDYVRYIDNEILIVVNDGVTEEQVRELAEKYNCKIVGAIEVTGDYQLRLEDSLTFEKLDDLIATLSSESIIDSATINYVSEMPVADEAVETSGFYYGEMWSGEFQNSNDVQGLSWGIKVINTNGAWNALAASKSTVVPVKLGLIDGSVDISHEDLKFAEVFYNDEVANSDQKHGTHVAGTMAARCDDKTGICGVYPYGKDLLYGVYSGGTERLYEATTMQEKLALAELIVRDVKVINSSRAWKWCDEPDFDRWYNKTSTDGHFKNHYLQVEIMGSFLQRMLDRGYDFVIVSAAGNNSRYIPDKLDCRYSAPYNGITEDKYPDVYNRIIVVGAVDYFLNVAVYSDGGSRVDIYAPGGDYVKASDLVNLPDSGSPGAAFYDYFTKDSDEVVVLGVFSTFPDNGYGVLHGTSMAAPHVAGVAAMVWSANNSLTGEDVKNCIKNNPNPQFTSYSMLDAERAVKAAIGTVGTGHDDVTENGTIIGCVTEEDGKSGIEKAKVTLANVATGEAISAYTDSDGGFEIVLPEGKYNITVTAEESDIYEWQDKLSFSDAIPIKKGEVLRIKDSIRMKKILFINQNGNIVFGNYEQDGDLADRGEAIEWEVLDKNENGWLLISKYVLDAIPYNDKYSEVTWETSTLRSWLNRNFLEKAFTAGEQALITPVSVTNIDFMADSGSNTDDKVFCLSVDEIEKYYGFKYDQYSHSGYCKALITEPTEYAKERGVWTYTVSPDDNFDIPQDFVDDCTGMTGAAWWLRTMGVDNNDACAVMPYGYAGADYEFGVNNGEYGVRPVLYIRIPSENGLNDKKNDNTPATSENKAKWVCTKETCYEYSSNFTDGVFEHRQEYEYDTSGRCTKVTNYIVSWSNDIVSDHYHEYVYDAFGNMISDTDYFADGNKYYWFDFEYDAKGLMTKKIYNFHVNVNNGNPFGNNYSSSKYIYEYDENGRLTKESHYDSYDKLDDWSEKVYDLAGNVIKDSYYDGDGSLERYSTFEYDKQGNLLKETFYDGDGKLSSSLKNEYGAQGNLYKAEHYNADDVICEIELYEYDSSGNKSKYTKYYADGTIPYWEEYEHDAYGNITKFTSYGSKGHFINRYEYEYKYIPSENE